jgi:hypothetical protein
VGAKYGMDKIAEKFKEFDISGLLIIGGFEVGLNSIYKDSFKPYHFDTCTFIYCSNQKNQMVRLIIPVNIFCRLRSAFHVLTSSE